MTNEERIERITNTLKKLDKKSMRALYQYGEYSNVVAMLNHFYYEDQNLTTYLAEMIDENSTVEGYLDQLERFLGL